MPNVCKSAHGVALFIIYRFAQAIPGPSGLALRMPGHSEVLGLLSQQSGLLLSQCSGVKFTGDQVGHPSHLVGTSSWAYLLPGVAMIRARTRLIEASAWILQANLSYAADYSHVLEDSPVHVLDRVCATGLFLANVRVGIHALRSRSVFVVPFMALAGTATACLHHGRQTESFQEYELAHSAWHVLGAAAVVLGVFKFPRLPRAQLWRFIKKT